MCLAVPWRIVAIHGGDNEHRIGRIDFQGSRMDASLLLTPEARIDDWVLVHAGFAIRRLDKQEAFETWEYLRDYEQLGLDDSAQGAAREMSADQGGPQ